ncbi:MAG: radical SAM family heme chaperone HemW [Bacillota bacterium]
MKSAGLYIHIPFCLKKCAYCDFVSYAGREDAMESYVQALLCEMEVWSRSFPYLRIPTAYIGGGTPSFLYHGLIARIIGRARELFLVEPDAEITVEANPKTLDERKLEEYLDAGVNRLSIGLQSANNDLLKVLGRAHSAEDFAQTVTLARRAGFENISADVMYGLPGQTVTDHLAAINMACQAGAKHVSAYALTLEEGTPLDESVREGTLSLPDEDLQYAMFREGKNLLESLGFRRYEISNYARIGYASCHNMAYWQNEPYIGLGAAAHSCVQTVNGIERLANTDNLEEYIMRANSGEVPAIERNYIDAGESMFETMMLGLRLVEGVELDAFRERYGVAATDHFSGQIDKLIKAEMIFIEKGRIKPTPKGLDFHSRAALEFLEK